MNTTPDAYWQSIGLAAPARRALIGAGITSLHDVAQWRAVDLAQLHGIGTHALSHLRRALTDVQLTFADERAASQ
ncbi:MAG: DNA-binding protein [Chloroflexota bacterium]|jgi:hypothetical protein